MKGKKEAYYYHFRTILSYKGMLDTPCAFDGSEDMLFDLIRELSVMLYQNGFLPAKIIRHSKDSLLLEFLTIGSFTRTMQIQNFNEICENCGFVLDSEVVFA